MQIIQCFIIFKETTRSSFWETPSGTLGLLEVTIVLNCVVDYGGTPWLSGPACEFGGAEVVADSPSSN